MAPLQVILLLILVRLPSALGALNSHAANAHGWAVMGSFFVAQFFLILIVGQQARGSLRELNNPSTSAAAVGAKMDRLISISRWSTIAITGLFLFVLHVPQIVAHGLAQTVIIKQIPLLPEAIYLMPALVAWMGFWTANYFVEQASRERSLPYRLAMGLPAHPMPSLSSYLSMQLRHNLFLIVPVGAASLVEELGDRVSSSVPYAREIAAPLGGLIILVMSPWIITLIWKTVPLRGELRSRLDGVAARYKLRFRNILIWKTHNAVTNAAILGYIPFSRYFLMTDALLESLTDQQIESVFAHEVGHGVHRHIPWYLLGGLGAIMLCVGVTGILIAFVPVTWITHVGGTDTVEMVLPLLLLMGFAFFGFSFVSHRFEHQADWFACRHMGDRAAETPAAPAVTAAQLAEPTEPLDEALPVKPPQAEDVTLQEYAAGHYPHAQATTGEPAVVRRVIPARAEGVEVFVSSLESIIDLAHRSRNRGGWMHPSVNDRVALLRRMGASGPDEEAFTRRMRMTRLLIAAVVIVGIGTLYLSYRIAPPERPAPAASPDPNGSSVVPNV